jgi:hypothetical protein
MSPVETPAASHRCLRPGCGRKLTSFKSVAAGYGPTCLRKIRQAQLDEARRDFSAAQQASADELIRDAGIIPAGRDGIFRCVSSKGGENYTTHAHGCNCKAGLQGRRCYHQLAARILGIASRPVLRRTAPVAIPAPAVVPEWRDIWAELDAMGATAEIPAF